MQSVIDRQKKLNLRLVSCIIKGDTQGAESVIKSREADLDGFSRFAWNNHIAGTLYAVTTSTGLGRAVPRELLDRLKPSYLKQWTKNEKLLDEIKSLSESFRDAGEEVLFLKGPFLAERFYGDIDRRAISDIDLLIKKSSIGVIEKILGEKGYTKMSYVFPVPGLSFHFAHHFEFEKQDTALDLHWSLSPHFTYRIDYNDIRKEKRVYRFRGEDYYVLPDEYELVFQILSIFRDTELGSITLKSHIDAYMILRRVYRETDWDEFFATRRKERTYTIALNVLDLVLGLLDCRSEFPHLSSVIERDRASIRASGFDRKIELLSGSGFTLRNKRWAIGLYETNPVYSILWWLASLPVKLPVYRQSSSKLFRRGE